MKMLLLVVISLLNIGVVSATSYDKKIWEVDTNIDNASYITKKDDYMDLYDNKISYIDNGYILESKITIDNTIKKVLVKVDSKGNLINKLVLDTGIAKYQDKVYYTEDSVIIFDKVGSNTQVTKYDSNLKFLEEYTIDYIAYEALVSFVNGNMYVFTIPIYDRMSFSYTWEVHKYNSDFERLDNIYYSSKVESKDLITDVVPRVNEYIDSYDVFYYDEIKNMSFVFDYEKDTFNLIDHKVIEDDLSKLKDMSNEYCESSMICTYGKLDEYYYINYYEEHDLEAEYNETIVFMFDKNYKEIMKFRSNSDYWKSLVASNNDYLIYISNDELDSYIRNNKLDKREISNISGSIVNEIINDNLIVSRIIDGNLVISNYDLAHYIDIQDNNGGTVKVDNLVKFTSDKVLLNIISDTGYEVDSIEVLDEDGTKLTINDKNFIMPDSDVVVNVNFVKGENPNTSDSTLIYLSIGIISMILLIILIKKYRTSM